ncbi:hypothetical protein Saso_41550 [Streptomyces asoensis]|uniref:Uncharacterized protein n=1 Tax=Streptomyces asoensis TaxID=249586 RepID=A0ABQ3S399_9ACTN|nr:hypothetical protein GCM10010496_62040 [Streptomyces asoensis]GHI62505.1 hypothetical protein Saso_41550 [Streptomyces asoensis]
MRTEADSAASSTGSPAPARRARSRFRGRRPPRRADDGPPPEPRLPARRVRRGRPPRDRSGRKSDGDRTEQEGRAARLFLMHRWFDPDDFPAHPAVDRRAARRGRSPGKAGVKAVTAQAPRVHVHLLMRLHVNGVMIRDS